MYASNLYGVFDLVCTSDSWIHILSTSSLPDTFAVTSTAEPSGMLTLPEHFHVPPIAFAMSCSSCGGFGIWISGGFGAAAEPAPPPAGAAFAAPDAAPPPAGAAFAAPEAAPPPAGAALAPEAAPAPAAGAAPEPFGCCANAAAVVRPRNKQVVNIV